MSSRTNRWVGLWLCTAALVACQPGASSGPAQVKWDRDVCGGCSMVISEPHFASQVRGGPKQQVTKFDDIGCALKWLGQQPWADEPATQVWVARYDAPGPVEWLDAKTARFLPGKTSPMGFNFGAVAGGADGRSFDEVRAQVSALGAR